MHPGVPGKVNVAAQERHGVAMEPHFDGGWINEIPLGAPELGPGEVELVRPVLNAADAEAFNEGGGQMPMVCPSWEIQEAIA